MQSAKALLGGVLGKFLFRSADVVEKRQVSARFFGVRLQGEGLHEAGWEPGDKVQVFLPGVGMRTYTPFGWDVASGTTDFLVFAHGSGPGATWARRVETGERVQLFGPRRSLQLTGPGNAVLFGDETSFAVARALSQREGTRLRCVFEVTDRREAASVLSDVGLDGVSIVERAPNDAHLDDAHQRIVGLLDGGSGASLVMTGRAQSIQIVQKRMKARGESRPAHVKAYWSVGKSGLD